MNHFPASLIPIQITPNQKHTARPSSSFLPSSFPASFLLSPYTPVMKEIHHHVLTRTRMQRESDAEFQMHLFSPPSPGSHWHPQS